MNTTNTTTHAQAVRSTDLLGILPCPFCGSEPKDRRHGIECIKCGVWFGDGTAATEFAGGYRQAWNRRCSRSKLHDLLENLLESAESCYQAAYDYAPPDKERKVLPAINAARAYFEEPNAKVTDGAKQTNQLKQEDPSRSVD